MTDDLETPNLAGSQSTEISDSAKTPTAAADDWAIGIKCCDVILRGYHRAVADYEPPVLTQRMSQNPILCGGAVEYFSQDMPVWHPNTAAEEGTFPIDILFGLYNPTVRSIEIFVNRINQDAKMFGAESNELLEIIRIHEHAHAVIHLGSRVDDVQKHLSALGADCKTDWSTFISGRTSWFIGFPAELHEFLAQAMTYAAICKHPNLDRSRKLREVFDALEAKQPAHYKLTEPVKARAALANWALILDAARGAIDVYREPVFTLATGIESLICAG